MTFKKNPELNKTYIIAVSAFTFVIPIICTITEILLKSDSSFLYLVFGKWFIFSAVGLRLFLAGIKQTTNPIFTLREIFKIDSTESLPIVRELGFSNLCFGLIGLISLFVPSWRIVSAFGSGLYYGLAGLQHFIKKPVGANEKFALYTDILISVFLIIYVIKGMN